jgi:ubiquinol-cytochrome c reductase cytochrome c1 subunit
LGEDVYYNKYMDGNQIKMPNVLFDDLVEYEDGTKATTEQMAKDVSNFLMWAAEPNLEERHKLGFRVILYLIILALLVYFSMNRLWSRIESKK